MGIIFRALKMLLPKGALWNVGEKFSALLECIATEVEKLREYQSCLIRESTPLTTEDSIKQWLNVFEIKDTNITAVNKKLLAMYATSFGGQSVGYFNKVIGAQYPNLIVSLESNKSMLIVRGQLSSHIEYLMFIDFTEKIFPAYILINYDIAILENYGQYAECGSAECGVAECGYQEK